MTKVVKEAGIKPSKLYIFLQRDRSGVRVSQEDGLGRKKSLFSRCTGAAGPDLARSCSS